MSNLSTETTFRSVVDSRATLATVNETFTIPNVSPGAVYTWSAFEEWPDEDSGSICTLAAVGATEVDYTPTLESEFQIDYANCRFYALQRAAEVAVVLEYEGKGSIVKASDHNNQSASINAVERRASAAMNSIGVIKTDGEYILWNSYSMTVPDMYLRPMMHVDDETVTGYEITGSTVNLAAEGDCAYVVLTDTPGVNLTIATAAFATVAASTDLVFVLGIRIAGNRLSLWNSQALELGGSTDMSVGGAPSYGRLFTFLFDPIADPTFANDAQIKIPLQGTGVQVFTKLLLDAQNYSVGITGTTTIYVSDVAGDPSGGESISATLTTSGDDQKDVEATGTISKTITGTNDYLYIRCTASGGHQYINITILP